MSRQSSIIAKIMKSIKRKFEEVKNKHAYWSSYVIFFHTINKGRFGKKAIYYWFNRLVDKDDYCLAEKRNLLSHLRVCSNMPVEGMKKPPISI